MESIKNAANYMTESVKGAGATTSKEAHKAVAKDPEAPVTSRAGAAKEAAGEKVEETSHEAKADVSKEAAKR